MAEDLTLGLGDDFAQVQARLRWLNPPDLRDAFVALWAETEELVAANWHHVIELGRMLAVAERLDDDQIYGWWDELLKRRPTRRFPRKPSKGRESWFGNEDA